MGFNARKLSKIVFEEGHDLHGLEITVRSSSLAIQKAYVQNYPRGETADRFAQMEYAGRHFLKHVVEWNLEDDDGKPVPTEWEAFETELGLDQITPIVQAYAARSIGAKAEPDTEKKSESGASTENTHRMEESLPMEVSP